MGYRSETKVRSQKKINQYSLKKSWGHGHACPNVLTPKFALSLASDVYFAFRVLCSAIPENREFTKWKFSFFRQRHALWTSFDILVVTYRVINFLPKLVDILLFSMGKNWISIFCFSPIFGLCRCVLLDLPREPEGQSSLQNSSPWPICLCAFKNPHSFPLEWEII